MTIKDIIWHKKNKPLELNLEYLKLLKCIPFSLPKLFIELLMITNGGYIDYIGIGEIYHIRLRKNLKTDHQLHDYNDLIDNYQNAPDFFPKNIVAFGETGNGDKICFDYRFDPKTDDPPIVYWNHDSMPSESLTIEAKNFEEFISMLEEPEKEPDAADDMTFEEWYKSLPR